MSLVSSVKRKSGSLMKNITMCTVCTQRIACLAGSTKCTTTSTTSKQCMKSLTKNMVLALVHALVHCMVASVHCALHCWQVQCMTSLEGSTKSTRTNTMSAQSTTSLVSIGDSAMVDTTSMRSIAVWWARWTGEHHEEPYD